MNAREQRLLIGLALLSCIVLGVDALGFLPLDVLFFAPALVLVLPLLGGRYIGEEQIARNARARAETRPRPKLRVPLPAAPRIVAPHGGRLMAFGLATRPPPFSAVPS